MPMRTMHRVNGNMFQDLLRYEKAREMTDQKDVLAQCAKRPDTDQIMAVLRKVTTGHLYRDLTCERWKDGIDITVPTYAAERLAEEFAAIGALTPAGTELQQCTEALEDVPGETLIDRVNRLKDWHQQLSNSYHDAIAEARAERDQARGLVEKLTNTIKRIDAINDNPARFNVEIDEVCRPFTSTVREGK